MLVEYATDIPSLFFVAEAIGYQIKEFICITEVCSTERLSTIISRFEECILCVCVIGTELLVSIPRSEKQPVGEGTADNECND